MRVIDLDTGDTLQAANDDDLARAVKRLYEDRGESMTDEEASGLVSERAYEAADA
jgi:adenylate kinase family enzyme